VPLFPSRPEASPIATDGFVALRRIRKVATFVAD